MLEFQIHLLTAWWQATDLARKRLQTARRDDRG